MASVQCMRKPEMALDFGLFQDKTRYGYKDDPLYTVLQFIINKLPSLISETYCYGNVICT